MKKVKTYIEFFYAIIILMIFNHMAQASKGNENGS